MKEIKTQRTWKVGSSRLAKNTFNPIRNILETMDLKPNPKKKMISLSIGDPTVFGNLKPDEVILEAVKESLDSGKYNGYASSTGYPEAREAVAEHVATSASPLTGEDVVLCSGCSCALDLCISALADPGQNILIPRPGFSLYSTLAVGLGIGVKEYDLLPERGWEADLDHMESQIDENTTAILVNNPSNPCGSVYTREHLLQILEVAERHCLPIIADEIYDHFVFPGHKYIPIASLTQTVPVLSCGGLTKRFLVPGWRLGWITIHDRNNVLGAEVRNGLKSLSQRIIGANTLIQGALPIILKETPASFFSGTIDVIRRNAELAFERLSKVPGLRPVMPAGAMYMMVGVDAEAFPSFKNDLEVVEALIREQSVFCLPGKCFNIANFFRIVLTIPERFMLEACDRIAEFCAEHVHQSLPDRLSHAMVIGDSSEEASASSSSGASSSDESDALKEDLTPPELSVVNKKPPAAASSGFATRKRFTRPPPLLRRDTVSRLV